MTRSLIWYGQVGIAVLMLILTAGFYFQWSWTTSLWPWKSAYTDDLSYFFLASITISIGISVLWVALSGKQASGAGGALDLIVSFVPISIFMFQDYAASAPGNPRVLISAIVMAVGAVANVLFFIRSRNMPVDPNAKPMPRLVTYSFIFFIVALVIVGGLLILKTPTILPWQLGIEGMVIYGWIFLGASLYFLYAVLYPNWDNAAGPSLGFLGYDLILILPFIRHFADVRPEHRLSLIIYTFVVVYSAALSIYYLFINPSTRIVAKSVSVPEYQPSSAG